MKKISLSILLGVILLSVNAQNRASWMKDAKWGVMIHYTTAMLASENLLDPDSINLNKWNDLIDNFDCEGLAKQLSDAGAGYLIINIRHSSDGYFLSPNSMYDHYMGKSRTRCSNRDLIVDLYHALDKYGIKLIAYSSSKFIKGPDEIKAFAYDRDDPRKAEAYLRWQNVIREYSMRWGDKVSGWWIDGCYLPNTHFRHPDIPNFASMAAAMRAGNPNSIVAFNPGRFPRIMSVTPYEDYTAGEINEPEGISFRHTFDETIDGRQIHILSYLGRKWGVGDPRFTEEQAIRYSKEINAEGGAVTWDVPPLRNGTISDDYMKQLHAIGKAINCNEGRRYDVTFKSLLYEMADRSVVTHWPEYEYKSLQTSSYDRKSITPDDHDGWFANNDHGHDLGVEVNQGRKEAVLLEHNGPGVITRIWIPSFYKNLKDRVGKDIMFYLDGDTIPTIKTNFIDLVTGKGKVNEPFAQYTCRAGDLYLPVSFAKSCKITMADSSFYYIINYRAYEEGTKVETFKPEFLNQYKNVLNEVGNALLNPEMFEGGNAFAVDESIPSGESTVLKLPNGNNAVRHLEFQLGADNLPQALRSTVLEATFDDERTIWCPLGDFFANVNAVDPYKMWEREVKTDGTMICRWIMPYKENAELRLINFAEESVHVNVKVNTSEWNWDDTSLHFHANWWTDMPYAPRPVFDLNFIEIKGRGIHVGDNLIVLNSHWSWWGEGDEKIYVDEDFDRSFPSHFGTGTEDYYGWAGGQVPTRDDEFSTPFLGNIRVGGLSHPSEAKQHAGRSGPFTHGYNICTRTRSLDATPFRTRFKFDMEAFNMISTPDAFLQYSLVTFWYGQPGAKHNRKPMPLQAAAPVPQAEDVVTFARQQLNEKGK